ncbi:MAG: ABC transporter substrate-binding protein [Steroidobacteraceae bacterium]|nr:ABC transporter substrate-binding protein [Deltaproteobacteria bacterium]
MKREAAILIILVLLSTAAARSEILPPADLSKAEIIRLGERMYRNGILPSGKVMDTGSRAEVEVDSTAFSCSSCHLRAGLGSVEGVVVTPPTTGAKLFKPAGRSPSPDDISNRAGRSVYSKAVAQRPAYDRESLANALRNGIDPAGRAFNDVMPRYPLSDRDMSILISYLETLSSEPSPGTGSTEIAFATIISDDVSQEDRQALLLPLQNFIAQKNQQMKMYGDFKKFGYSPTIDMKYAFRQASLDVWELKGPPETWQKQLSAYYSNKPVFAVLGGISNSDWRPVHDFCEAQHLPCLFPITDFPVISETGWYTYYFNKGYAQEGEAVARYLNQMKSLSAETPILQIVQDSPVGRALAAGFQSSWSELERPAVITLTLTASQLQDQAALGKLLKKHKPGVLLLWTDAGLLPNLPSLIARLAAPEVVFVSSGYMGKRTAAIAETVRDRVYITYPYRLTPYVGSKDGGYDAKVPFLASAKDLGDRKITSRSTTILKQSTLRALNLLYDNLQRDHLLDIMSMQMDLIVRDYERLNFGIGQRYVSKGCYIIQVGSGADPALLPRSEWVMH